MVFNMFIISIISIKRTIYPPSRYPKFRYLKAHTPTKLNQIKPSNQATKQTNPTKQTKQRQLENDFLNAFNESRVHANVNMYDIQSV